MLADKPLDFENHPLDLLCLRAHTRIFCRHWLSELMITCQNMSETTSTWNVEILMNRETNINAGFQIAISKLNLVILKKIFSIHLNKLRTARVKF